MHALCISLIVLYVSWRSLGIIYFISGTRQSGLLLVHSATGAYASNEIQREKKGGSRPISNTLQQMVINLLQCEMTDSHRVNITLWQYVISVNLIEFSEYLVTLLFPRGWKSFVMMAWKQLFMSKEGIFYSASGMTNRMNYCENNKVPARIFDLFFPGKNAHCGR